MCIFLSEKRKQTKTPATKQRYNSPFNRPNLRFRTTRKHCQVVAQAFRNGEIQLLVTTDVMGRGLDIPGISHVGGLSESPKISQKTPEKSSLDSFLKSFSPNSFSYTYSHRYLGNKVGNFFLCFEKWSHSHTSHSFRL